MRSIGRLLPLLLCALVAGCAGEEPHAATPVAPAYAAAPFEVLPGVPFLLRGPGAPGFSDQEARLPAVAGAAGEATLRFADGSPLVTFRVRPESMRGARLQGRPVRPGDTVWITLRSADPARFIVDFQPSGLVFNPNAPAELTFFLRHAAPQGGAFTLWKQESEGDPWERVGACYDPVTRTACASIGGFTRYAMASGN